MLDENHKLRINGTDQWIYVRGQSSGPILLFVHGGPGAPLIPIARGFEKPFLTDYLVIHWDQRGIGRAFKSTDFSYGFSLDQFVSDGLSVVAEIQGLYPDQPIILVGHSWGSVVGVKMAATAPAFFKAYISVGTNSHTMAAENYRYEFLEASLREANDRKELQELRRIGRPPWASQSWQDWGHFTVKHIAHENSWGKISVEKIEGAIKLCLAAGDYSSEELEEVYSKGLFKSFELLADDYFAFSAAEDVPRLEVPVFFLQGKLDLNTPSHIAKEYYEILEAPRGKYWIEEEESSHMIFYENPDILLDVCRKVMQAEQAGGGNQMHR